MTERSTIDPGIYIQLQGRHALGRFWIVSVMGQISPHDLYLKKIWPVILVAYQIELVPF